MLLTVATLLFPTITTADSSGASVNTTLACAEYPAADESSMRQFLKVLSNPRDHATQASWWVQHTPLARIDHPLCERERNGTHCSSLDFPAYVRCSSDPGANRKAAPHVEGEWPLCRELLLRTPAASVQRPLAYSFGIAGEFNFDDQMADLGFEVHSFDPTTKFRQQHEAHNKVNSNVHFHYAGLQAESSCQQKVAKSGGSYGALGGKLLPLAEVRRQLGHAPAQRRLEVLKIEYVHNCLEPWFPPAVPLETQRSRCSCA